MELVESDFRQLSRGAGVEHREPDPAREYFDVVDEDGQPTGEVKARSAVHQDGDWHRSFHLWVVTSDETGAPAVLFQRRSAAKDTNPGRLDVAVGGHYRAGEGFDDVVREIEEELGFAPPQASLIGIGRRWSVDVRPVWVDREIQDVYVYHYSGSVAELRPSHEEIDALDLIPVVAMDALYSGTFDEITTERYEVQPGNNLAAMTTARVTLDDFIPVRDRYWLAGSHAAARVFAGETDVRLQLVG